MAARLFIKTMGADIAVTTIGTTGEMIAVIMTGAEIIIGVETTTGVRIADGEYKSSVRFFADKHIACQIDESLRFFRTDDGSIVNTHEEKKGEV